MSEPTDEQCHFCGYHGPRACAIYREDIPLCDICSLSPMVSGYATWVKARPLRHQTDEQHQTWTVSKHVSSCANTVLDLLIAALTKEKN